MRKFILILALMLVPLSSYAAVELREEGTKIGVVEEIDFVGSNVTATKSAGHGVVTVAENAIVEVGGGADTLTASESGKWFIESGTVEKELPAAANGLIFHFQSSTNNVISVDAASNGDTLKYLKLDAGDKVSSGGATGDTITVIGDGTNHLWYVNCSPTACTDGGA